MEEINQWPELPILIWQLLNKDEDSLIESGFKILYSLFNYSSDSFTQDKRELNKVFQRGINNGNINIKISAIKAFGSYIETVDSNECKRYEDIIPDIINNIIMLMQIDKEKVHEAFTVLIIIAEAEPKLLKKSFFFLFETMHKIVFDKVKK